MTSAINICPVCESRHSEVIFSLGEGKLIRCTDCNLHYYTPRPTPEELALFYDSQAYREQFSQNRMTGQEFALKRYQQFAQVCQKSTDHLINTPSKKLLDIGCGTGDFLQVAQKKGWQVEGTEISQKAALDARRKIEGQVFIGDLLTLDLPLASYDVITLFHVVEHLINPVIFLRKIKSLLKPNGLFFLETPNIGGIGFKLSGQKWSHLIPPEHISYFDPQSLDVALTKAGFSQIKTLTIAPQIIESLERFPLPIQQLGKLIYRGSSWVGIGPTLQAIAIPESP